MIYHSSNLGGVISHFHIIYFVNGDKNLYQNSQKNLSYSIMNPLTLQVHKFYIWMLIWKNFKEKL